MSAGIQPSPALMVSSNTPISECVRKMRDHGVGSLLLVSYSDPHQLVGIFTERDLLKWIDEVQQGGHWDKPVAHLMSKPVKTITLDDLDRAAEIMLQGHFRHIPVTTSVGGKQRVLGILSMRDLFADFASQKFSPRLTTQTKGKSSKAAALVLTSHQDISDLEKILTVGGKMEVLRRDFLSDVDVRSVEKSEMLLLDLDGVDPKTWAAFLQTLKATPGHPPAVILFDPRLHENQHAVLLRSLSTPGSLEVFAKPLNVMGFLSRVRQLSDR